MYNVPDCFVNLLPPLLRSRMAFDMQRLPLQATPRQNVIEDPVLVISPNENR